MPNQMRPIHPGEILKGEIEELGLSARQLAMALGVPTSRVTSIVHEARALTADTALWLARYFGASPEFWLNLQSAYELRRAQQEHGARIAQEVVPRRIGNSHDLLAPPLREHSQRPTARRRAAQCGLDMLRRMEEW
jgi:addiction module HigA family antidote